MVKSKISKTVSTDGTTISYEYAHFFLKGQWFLCYVIGDIKAPVCSTDEADKSFSMHLEEWDCKNHEIITWFRTTTLPSISSSLVFMRIRKIFGTSWLVVIPLTVSPTSISFKVCLSLWDKNLGNWSMIFFLVCSLFGINWSSLLIFSRIMRMLRLYPLKEINSDSSSYRWPCPLILSRFVLLYFSRSLY